jgi:hypothetical protein
MPTVIQLRNFLLVNGQRANGLKPVLQARVDAYRLANPLVPFPGPNFPIVIQPPIAVPIIQPPIAVPILPNPILAPNNVPLQPPNPNARQLNININGEPLVIPPGDNRNILVHISPNLPIGIIPNAAQAEPPAYQL